MDDRRRADVGPQRSSPGRAGHHDRAPTRGLRLVLASLVVAGFLTATCVPGLRAQAPPDSSAGPYGPSYAQLAAINAVEPLERGIAGRGVTVGFLDCTYRGFDHPAFDSLRAEGRLVAVRDFAAPQTCAHGLMVASVTVGFERDTLVGPAHRARVLAAVTEFAPTETRREEQNFVEGLAWLVDQGADVVNVSLGYTSFPQDPDGFSYRIDDLDGDTGVTTRAVDRAAAQGVVVVVSAGNSACAGGPEACWHYVGTPADADSAITVGAVGFDSTLANFSSRGPTADGRIKPDVVAPGVGVVAAVPGGYARVNGTSFAAPLVTGVVAQMLEVNPYLSPTEARAILRATASQATRPDTLVGWGVVDAAAAVAEAERRVVRATPRPAPYAFEVTAPYPNPAREGARVEVVLPRAAPVRLEVVDVLGRVRQVTALGMLPAGVRHELPVDASALAAGVYVLRVRAAGRLATRRLVVVR